MVVEKVCWPSVTCRYQFLARKVLLSLRRIAECSKQTLVTMKKKLNKRITCFFSLLFFSERKIIEWVKFMLRAEEGC